MCDKFNIANIMTVFLYSINRYIIFVIDLLFLDKNEHNGNRQ